MDEKLSLLNMMYDNAIEKINGLSTGHQELAKHVLAWITLARSPPSLTQVQHAWVVRDSEDKLNQDNLPEAQAIISACGGLVTVDKEHDIIQLVHHNPLLAHGGEFPSSFNIEGVPGRFTGLHLAAWLGIESATEELLVENKEPDAQDSKKRTPLSYAAENDHAAVVKLLLATGRVNVNTECLDFWDQFTPLHYAAQSENTAMVKMLLATGQAEVDRKSKSRKNRYDDMCWDKTPLHWAATQGHLDVWCNCS
ncbi:hypothetical protein VTI28DRAFT_4208 [Corynascus sepedonium]